MVKKLVVSSPTKNYCFFSNENSIVGDLNPKLHSDIALPQSVLRLNRLLFAVVVMLMTRVIDAGIVVVLVADRRDSFTGATIMNFHSMTESTTIRIPDGHDGRSECGRGDSSMTNEAAEW
ncbi:hypothetical protein YC2023_099079 [Brassica napus]